MTVGHVGHVGHVGGDPEELVRAARGGPGQAFTLDHTTRLLEHAGRRHAARNRASRVDTDTVVARLRVLARRITSLDHWVLLVAAALRAADATGVRARLLQFGAGHPAASAVVGPHAVAAALPVAALSDAELDEIAGWPRLAGPWRDRVHRERMRRWLGRTGDRISAVPEDDGNGPLDRLARWVDRRLIDRFSPLVDLHTDHAEAVGHHRAAADGVRWLLAQPDLTVWSFTPISATPSGGPAVRVALGNPGVATHLAVLLPGTGSGPHAPGESLTQARALYRHLEATAGAGVRVAVVLDLYDAPTDLGRAADPRPGRAAGAATAAFLAGLPGAPARTTIVGHSYGAFAAAQVRDQPVDALVLLGAPGVGVATRAELTDAEEVWAAQATNDPITAVADLDEFLADLPPRLRPGSGPLADPLVALGPDPADPDFGARALPTTAAAGDRRRPNRGHLDYLREGTVALDNIARVLLGRPVR